MRQLRILARPDIRKLILASFIRARTAFELSQQTGIPIARCYRLLWKLRSVGLITVEAARVNPRGRAKLLFRARLGGLEFFLKGDRIAGRIRRSRVLG